jgi:CarD family transcriptional regulator, regulator of rRNA transcription
MKKNNKIKAKAVAKTMMKKTKMAVKKTVTKSKPALKAKVKIQPKKAAVKKPVLKKIAAPIKKAVAKVAIKVAPKMAQKPVVAAKPVTKAVAPTMAKAPVVAAVAQRPVQQRPMAPNPMAPRMMGQQQRPMQHQGQRPMMGRPGAPVVMRPSNDTPVDFRAGDYVVYPAHGVGTIEGVETQSIAGMSVTLYAISFEKDRMRLKIPVQKAQTAGLRKLSTGDRLKDALKTLTGKARIKRTMWSRRAQEYEAKINSGDPVQIAEVLRDLRRPKDDTEQSYSERQIYQSALERLAREVAAVQRIAEAKAVEHLETVLAQAA